jgi:hypothetical protein
MSSIKLNLLSILPAGNRNYIFSLLNCTDISRLSACCHSLREAIHNDNTLWKEQYKREFLSSAYRKKEWQFIFWCIHTDPNTKTISTKRSDMLKNIDWYNTYRRRMTTENNWRYGYSNTAEIDLKFNDKRERQQITTRVYTSATSIILECDYCGIDESKSIYYNIKYAACSDLKYSNNNTHKQSLSTPSKQISLYENSFFDFDFTEKFNDYLLGDHYINKRKKWEQKDETSTTMTISLCDGASERTYATIDVCSDLHPPPPLLTNV